METVVNCALSPFSMANPSKQAIPRAFMGRADACVKYTIALTGLPNSAFIGRLEKGSVSTTSGQTNDRN